MKDFPKVIYKEYKEPEHDYSEELNNIFKKLANDAPEELLELRKQQIQNHSKNHFIIDTFNRLANLIGKPANHQAETIVEYCQEELIELHSPIYLTIPINPEPFHKWETWTFEKLYDKYFDLAMRKGWMDFYGINELSNLEKGEYLRYIKNYHIIDMLNDLVINDYIICGYEIRSFMNTDNDLRLLEPFKYDIFDQVIEVKLKEKFASMKEYGNYILNRE